MNKYRTIVADPPWPIRWQGGAAYRTNGRGERHLNKRFKKKLDYKTMAVNEIAALSVSNYVEDDAHLYLWTPDRFALEGAAASVARAWGFEPGRFLIWQKSGFGAQHELVLVCKRGRLPYAVNNIGSVQLWKLVYECGGRKHSAKPEGFFDLVERASPGPYLELFARRQRLGWHTWATKLLTTSN